MIMIWCIVIATIHILSIFVSDTMAVLVVGVIIIIERLKEFISGLKTGSRSDLIVDGDVRPPDHVGWQVELLDALILHRLPTEAIILPGGLEPGVHLEVSRGVHLDVSQADDTHVPLKNFLAHFLS